MQVKWGRSVPKGWLPVFSVDSTEEAQQLVIATCPKDNEGNFYARELAAEQTLENLEKFSDKLQMVWDLIQKRKVGDWT